MRSRNSCQFEHWMPDGIFVLSSANILSKVLTSRAVLRSVMVTFCDFFKVQIRKSNIDIFDISWKISRCGNLYFSRKFLGRFAHISRSPEKPDFGNFLEKMRYLAIFLEISFDFSSPLDEMRISSRPARQRCCPSGPVSPRCAFHSRVSEKSSEISRKEARYRIFCSEGSEILHISKIMEKKPLLVSFPISLL